VLFRKKKGFSSAVLSVLSGCYLSQSHPNLPPSRPNWLDTSRNATPGRLTRPPVKNCLSPRRMTRNALADVRISWHSILVLKLTIWYVSSQIQVVLNRLTIQVISSKKIINFETSSGLVQKYWEDESALKSRKMSNVCTLYRCISGCSPVYCIYLYDGEGQLLHRNSPFPVERRL
jgi:hypothetical protein